VRWNVRLWGHGEAAGAVEQSLKDASHVVQLLKDSRKNFLKIP